MSKSIDKRDEALKLALEALEKCDSALAEELAAWDIDPPLHHVQEASNACAPAITAISEALAEQPAQQELTDLQKDAANLLFALHDAWPYVHQWCTIESKRGNIVHLMRKHGDFADLYAKQQQEPVAVVSSVVNSGDKGVRVRWLGGFPQIGDRLYTSPPASKPWVGLTDEEADELVQRFARYELLRAIEAKLREKNT